MATGEGRDIRTLKLKEDTYRGEEPSQTSTENITRSLLYPLSTGSTVTSGPQEKHKR